MRHTIFTPTFNRITTLPRLYESIKAQTYKNFSWLIIDDGSTDNTQELVQKWIEENVISIQYIYKENGGKHTALQLALECIESKYIEMIDSDDMFTSTAMETFEMAWKNIEMKGLEDQIAQVKMFSMYESGQLVGYGDFLLPQQIDHLDGTWHELVLKHNCHRELVDSTNVSKLKQCINISKYNWKQEYLRFISEFILWSAIGRTYKTRIINNIGRIYYMDGSNSILRGRKETRHYINDMVNNMYFVDENIDYFFYNPLYFIKFIIKYIIAGFIVKESIHSQWKIIRSKKFKVLYIISFFPACMFYFKMKYCDHQFYLG
ncbi:glycosyltransferase family A protein [Microbacter margulisiae]|uniref:Glycosyltransferase involved in cell wall biosynthesis n=1 Tax=Microbacter margulisiae TaxID=1350067 RepID=A0A7W5H0R6_9PORP|nr:glycosyltransferase family 2 protein [Microbacter margulisiae]MBB3185990.1 glycosyltransferase involved in cell wall biosynthesis [Microbacter margulisiae]